MKDYIQLVHDLTKGEAPHDIRQKVYQFVLDQKQAIIDLLSIAIPQITEEDPLIKNIQKEDMSLAPLLRNEEGQIKLMREKKLDYLIHLSLEKIKTEVYLLLLHQSSQNQSIELQMAEYIIGKYRNDYQEGKPLLGTLCLILNTDVNSKWRPKDNFIDVLEVPDHALIKEGSLNFRIWSVNANDPHLKELGKNKAIMALLIAEQLSKKGLKRKEAIKIYQDALTVINSFAKEEDSLYHKKVLVDFILMCGQYPENRRIIEELQLELHSNEKFDRKVLEEINMTYSEQMYREALAEGVSATVEVMKQTLKNILSLRFSHSHLIDEIQDIQDPETLGQLTTFLASSPNCSEKDFRSKLQELVRE